MNDELLSIIIPVFNGELCIEKCVKSIEKQKYSNYELILINDGSTDNTFEICERLAQKNKKIKIFNKKNTGVSDTRNLGINEAKGKYIQFVDADDEIYPTLSSKLIDLIKKEQADLGICGYTVIKNKKEINKVNENKNCNNYDLDFLYEKYLLHPIWNKVYIKEKISNMFDKRITLGEDLLFNINYLKYNSKIAFLPENLYRYNVTTTKTLSSKYSENLIFVNKLIYTKINELYKQYYKTKYNKDSINKIFYKNIIHNINNISINKKLTNKEKRKLIKENLNSLKELHDSKNIFIRYEMIEIIIMFYNLKEIIKQIRKGKIK